MGIRRNTSASRSEHSPCTVISAEELLDRVRTAADLGGLSPAFPKRKQAVAQLIRRITVFDDRVEIRLNVGLPTSPLKPLNSINTED